MNTTSQSLTLLAWVALGPVALLASPPAAPAAPTPPAAPAAPASEGTPFMGVVTEPVAPGLAAHLKLPANTGLVVESVVPNSAAAEAGLQRYDILLRFNDQMLINPGQLSALIGTHKVGDTVQLTLMRAGDTLAVPLTLKARSGRTRPSWAPRPPSPPAAPDAPEPPAPPVGQRQIIIVRPDGQETVINLPEIPQIHSIGDTIASALETALADAPDDATLSQRIARALERAGVTDPEELRASMAELRERLQVLGATRLQMDVRQVAEDAESQVRRISTLRVSNARRVYRGDEGTAELVEIDGSKRLTVKDPSGEVVFEGPVDTPEQQAALPDLARELHRKLSDPVHYEFRWEASDTRE